MNKPRDKDNPLKVSIRLPEVYKIQIKVFVNHTIISENPMVEVFIRKSMIYYLMISSQIIIRGNSIMIINP